jgi:hypothetical protein
MSAWINRVVLFASTLLRLWLNLPISAPHRFLVADRLGKSNGPNQTFVRLIQRANHRSSPIVAFQRVHELSERQRTCGVKEQRPLAGVRFARRARRFPVSPFAWDRKRGHFGVT